MGDRCLTKEDLRDLMEEERDRRDGVDRRCPRMGCDLLRSQSTLGCHEDRCPFDGYRRRF